MIFGDVIVMDMNHAWKRQKYRGQIMHGLHGFAVGTPVDTKGTRAHFERKGPLAIMGNMILSSISKTYGRAPTV